MLAAKRIQSLEQELANKDKQLLASESKVLYLQEQLQLARAQRFGRSSEQYVIPNQLSLFDEGPEIITPEEEIEVPAHTRKTNRGKRKPLPEGLERVRIEYKLDAADLIGPDGEQYIKIGESISEQLDIVPAEVRVLQHVRFKYAVKGKEELGVKTAPITNQAIPKSIASSGLLAHIAQAKYCHHLPLYRQEMIWRSLDVFIPRNSMCRWMLDLGEKCTPIVEELLEQIKSQRHLHVDETTVTVINDNNKKEGKPSHNGYMWVYTNDEAVVYDYQSSREGIHPFVKLDDFYGYIQTDAYAGYNQLFKEGERVSVGCWAHARRKFTDVLKSLSKKRKNTHAEGIIKMIGKLYKIEKFCLENQLTHDEKKRYRLEKSKPILDKIKKHLEELQPKTPPQGLLGKAAAYTLNNWAQLTNYLKDGCIPIDNNPAERKIRPFTIGRRNWTFCGNTKGAEASANLYSLIESAKLYNLKVFDYLKFVFENAATAESAKDFESLTPKYAHTNLPKLKEKPKT